jgi:hypothetical protein
LVSLFSQILSFFKAYLMTPLRVFPSFPFDNPKRDYLVTPVMTRPTMASQ